MKTIISLLLFTGLSLRAGVLESTPSDPVAPVRQMGLNQIKFSATSNNSAIVAIIKIRTAGKLTYHREVISYNSHKSDIAITYGNPEWARGGLIFAESERHLIDDSNGLEFKTTTTKNGFEFSANSSSKSLSICVTEESLASLALRHKDYTINAGTIERSSTYPLPTDG